MDYGHVACGQVVVRECEAAHVSSGEKTCCVVPRYACELVRFKERVICSEFVADGECVGCELSSFSLEWGREEGAKEELGLRVIGCVGILLD
jgi:hypothetical protein